ncbi:MAG: hypothetical protein M3020_28165 [Myxococcota bacterium]|nr:hypothetical protein [Myxococcota bacterium]
MIEERDPPRFSEADSDAGPELRELFRSAALDLPSDARLLALRGRLPDPPAAPPPGSVGKSGLLGSGGRALAIVAAVGGLAALLAVIGLQSSAPRTETTTPPMAASAPKLTEPVPQAPVPSAVEPAPASIEPAAEASAPPASAARVKTPNEAALLERARRALSKNPALALELTRRHQAEFPRGVLRQEREVIAIEALSRLGKADQARERGTEFRREFPNSAHGRAVDRGLVP